MAHIAHDNWFVHMYNDDGGGWNVHGPYTESNARHYYYKAMHGMPNCPSKLVRLQEVERHSGNQGPGFWDRVFKYVPY